MKSCAEVCSSGRKCTQLRGAYSLPKEGIGHHLRASVTQHIEVRGIASPSIYTYPVLSLGRCRQPEIMDSPHLDEFRHRRALDALHRINWISRAAAQIWVDIRRLQTAEGNGPLRVLDLACGGGDVVLALERCARRHGVDLEVRGCDASPVAVQRATEKAASAGSSAVFFRLDVLREPLPEDADVICSTLFLHHLDEAEAAGLLRKMAAVARRMVVIQDLARSRAGFALAYLAVYVLTRSDVARVDGPLSVRAAFTPEEALRLAQRAGLDMSVRRCWPRRYNLVWERP